MVTVAPSGYTGEADYYCTGEHDEIQINAAIIYLHESSDGGKVYLLEGIYNVHDSVVIEYDNITLEGSGNGTVINNYNEFVGGYEIIAARGDVATYINNIIISNMMITQSVTQLRTGVGIDYTSNIAIHNITTKVDFGIYIYTTVAGKVSICNNTCLASSYVSSTGIFVTAGDTILINSNICDNTFVGIRCTSDNTLITNNCILNCSSKGIYNAAGSDNSYIGNYCYNNGSDAGIGNDNLDNFLDSGTDTQVYSNSWQSPVSGQPSYGELHAATAQSAFTTLVSATTVIASCDISAYVPVGANAAGLLQVGFGNYQYFVASKNASCTTTTNLTNIRSRNVPGAGSYTSSYIQVPIDANRKFYYRSWDGAAGCGSAGAYINLVVNGYYS